VTGVLPAARSISVMSATTRSSTQPEGGLAMSSAANTLVKRLVVAATLAGVVAGIAFLLVARGGAAPEPATSARPWHTLPEAPVKFGQTPTSVWTGSKLIVFGRRQVTALDSRGAPYVVKSVDAAESYDPATKTWARLSPPAGPGYVPSYNAVWDGKEMLVFGAFHSVAYNPATNTWRTLRKSVGGGLVIWTGREAIGWGGGCCGDAWGNGLAYNPATDSYRELAPSPLAPSQGPIGAWTGRELVLFSSGFNPGTAKPYPASFARAAAYNPATDTWRRITLLPSSELGFGGAAAWDGHEVLVAGDGRSARAAFAYDPATNRRRALAPMPFGLRDVRAFWTGDRLLVWGGSETGRGLAYDLRSNRWSVLPAASLPGFPTALGWTVHSLVVATGVHAAAFTPPR
jgi:hypothetical protein